MSPFLKVLLNWRATVPLLMFASMLLSNCGGQAAPTSEPSATGTGTATPKANALFMNATSAPTASRSACTDLRNMETGRVIWLALGDSYTVGEGVKPEESWPVQLAERLREQGVNVTDPTFAAFSGMTTGELHFRLERLTFLRDRYDLVTLQIGANDQFRGSNAAEYGARFEALLRRALRFVSTDRRRLIVLSIPDYSVTPFAADRNPTTIQREIATFNEANRNISRRYGVHYVDIAPLSREMTAGSPYVSTDSLHPSGEMYTLWSNMVLPVACAALLSIR